MEDSGNYEALRAGQVEALLACGGIPMGLHHYNAIMGGLPPEDCCIVTPESFKNQCDAGIIPDSQKPMQKLEHVLSKIVGPQQNISLTNSFNGNNPAEQRTLSPILSNLFNPPNPA